MCYDALLHLKSNFSSKTSIYSCLLKYWKNIQICLKFCESHKSSSCQGCQIISTHLSLFQIFSIERTLPKNRSRIQILQLSWVKGNMFHILLYCIQHFLVAQISSCFFNHANVASTRAGESINLGNFPTARARARTTAVTWS